MPKKKKEEKIDDKDLIDKIKSERFIKDCTEKIYEKLK